MVDAEKEGRRARRLFSHAHMSDTKWRKLFLAVADAGLNARQAIVKFIDVDEPRPMAFPTAGALHPPRPYIDTMEFGPIELRAIEWLEILAEAVTERRTPGTPPRREPQDLDGARAVIEKLGLFLLDDTPGGLRVIGYSR
ncbi:hypothetical protein JOD31_002068 [Methylopila capsulata]|uniref:Uncharacterized protein n=1 Tax=Methylopila capsulata TaxID=61654 RepID=A0A9W6IRM4_9HYPH|nr:hypothetical protein [Methylopila capsulata]MBM7851843.1 hypothetical protein [Methylopila capsulata]GLK54908.1 hypothetical protein GCM10008170_09270 [Methylopila capsulata]